ncbi:arylformamidase [Mangrovibacillus cuniculi]|uniref:Kynurenine formamidase n=1 Tax=Mangrovibacillus cuniculi TaxID=2593652 RepID=A0A7S8C9Y1_9BACI|nr:arylformamidase [Mangrovibacillus cuniculi]QPC46110.1 arylformamidase [Mangrovibacillus cuniculi]
MIIIDITQTLDSNIAPWPGDTPFSYKVNWEKEATGSVNVGEIRMSCHLGTHIDAPFHYDDKGAKVHELPLDGFVGQAFVKEINHKKIEVVDLQSVDFTGITKLLIRTNAWKEKNSFPSEIPTISPDVASFLRKNGVDLIGVDLPSVDQLDSKALPTHHAFQQNGLNILEGIVLDNVKEGNYELIALPLKLKDADGSPVRAILIDKNS